MCTYNQETLLRYEKVFHEMGLQSERGMQSRMNTEIVGHWTVTGADKNHQKLIDELLADKDIKEFDF